MVQQHKLPVLLTEDLLRRAPLRYFEDERRLSPVELGLESAFVVCFSDRVDAASGSAECDESCAALCGGFVSGLRVVWGGVAVSVEVECYVRGKLRPRRRRLSRGLMP